MQAARAAGDLLRLLHRACQVRARKRLGKLVVEIRPVGHRHHRRVGKPRITTQLVDEEHHRVALPAPCVCHTRPPRLSPSGGSAAPTDSTAASTACTWWYLAITFQLRAPSDSNSTKSWISSSSRSGANTPSIITSSCERLFSSPAIDFHCAKCSGGVVLVPTRASTRFETPMISTYR